jgi:TRAP-type C4-dicarboxylate transport system permease small subunit
MKKEIDLAGIFRHVVAILFLIIISVTCAQVVSRYVFNKSIVWSEELVRFLVIWMCMIGAAVSCYDDSHMMIDSFIVKLPRKAQFFVYTIRQLLITAFSIAASLASFKLIKAAWPTKSGALGISMGLWRAAGTVGLMLIAVYTVLRFIKDFNKFRREGKLS